MEEEHNHPHQCVTTNSRSNYRPLVLQPSFNLQPSLFYGQSDSQHPPFVKSEAGGTSHNDHYRNYYGSSCEPPLDDLKAKIIAHPQYSTLLQAYINCQKVGAPPEVVARLTAVRQEFEERQGAAAARGSREVAKDPELDQFMEAYSDMVVKYSEEVRRPLEEAMEFITRIETQLSTITNAQVNPNPSERHGGGSSDEEQENSNEEMGHPGIDPREDERDLKSQLLKKYSGYLSSLKQEFSKKKKKGKLPKDARQKLLSWWEMHYRWPYPSESEKVALAESTGLDQKQINNWFINQRKRHWKPSEDMHFMMMDGLHYPQNDAALYTEAHYLGGSSYRLGPVP